MEASNVLELWTYTSGSGFVFYAEITDTFIADTGGAAVGVPTQSAMLFAGGTYVVASTDSVTSWLTITSTHTASTASTRILCTA